MANEHTKTQFERTEKTEKKLKITNPGLWKHMHTRVIPPPQYLERSTGFRELVGRPPQKGLKREADRPPRTFRKAEAPAT